ncbi:phage shock protein A [Trueperella bonasi]|uniref:Phage shock protein A n=1 Tax=Trueperella bonasi TaxID=312286 RepID=A0ABT9NF28_9ACTO|nr:hypothetical protein [Trueperella bonasi]MDP9806000.1 phage shock protein A [Trueperella bonasi]
MNEDIRQLRTALRATQNSLAREVLLREEAEKRAGKAEEQLATTREQLESLRKSASWQATLPMRAFKRRVGELLP